MGQIKGIRWTERAGCKVRMKNTFTIRVGKFEEEEEEKRKIPSLKWKDDIETGLKTKV